MTRIEKARQMAHEAHASIDQQRKYTGEPYAVHPDAVAATVQKHGLSEDAICAAYLHDVIEDVFPVNPKYDTYWIALEMGERVARIVTELTDVYTREAWPDCNRAKRKALERERVGGISYEAKSVKLADFLDNVGSIASADKDFALVYLQEKRDMLPFLVGGCATLLQEAQQVLEKVSAELCS